MTQSLPKALLGGAAGTAAMTAMMYGVAPMMGLHMDIAAMLGSMMGNNWTLGMVAHLMNGVVIFPMAYALVVASKLPGSPAMRGMLFGVGLWLVAQAMVMPMMGGGLFSSAMGGMMAAGGSLMGHLIYGVLLGQIGTPTR